MKTNKTKKGFTLMELVVVLAILGILLAIIVPSWGYFLRRARERSANAKAKIVFNAAQTEITRISMKERPDLNLSKDSTADSQKRADAAARLYVGEGDFYFYWNSATDTAQKIDYSTNPPTTSSNTGNDISLARAINNINNNGEGFYKIYVKDYNVQAVVYSDFESGRYKGTYPKSIGTNQLIDSVEDDIRRETVYNCDLSQITLP
ncbi:type II secretion system protein [Ruminococcus flavefaciens]|uniref:type II secretion system protein n=1 Tax=Ruminococcus flavefaciens TaxID=1265 RepID=UPI00031E19D1|nr:type II secretion system protein [Ruminococcus flavefaciens]